MKVICAFFLRPAGDGAAAPSSIMGAAGAGFGSAALPGRVSRAGRDGARIDVVYATLHPSETLL